MLAHAGARQGRRVVGSANVLFGPTRFACRPVAPLIPLRRPPGSLGVNRRWCPTWWTATIGAGSGRWGALRSEIKGAFE